VILLQGGILQRVASSSDGDRAQQQTLERGAEGDIASLDGIARIAQQMRQAYRIDRVGVQQWLLCRFEARA
jgi:hypothetical protein